MSSLDGCNEIVQNLISVDNDEEEISTTIDADMPAATATAPVNQVINISELLIDYNKTKTEKKKLAAVIVNQAHKIHVLQSKLVRKQEYAKDWLTHFTEREQRILQQISNDENSDKRFIRHIIEILYKNNMDAVNNRSLKGRSEYLGTDGRTIHEKLPVTPDKLNIIKTAFEARVDGDEARSKETYFNRIVNRAICQIRDKINKRKRSKEKAIQ